MKGNWGRALFVDLSQKSIGARKIPGEWFRDYVGGEGTAMRLLYELMNPALPIDDTRQPLIFSTGPLTGTAAPCSGRSTVVFRSPLSGGVGAANAGGYFAPALKKARFDLLVITGRIETPSYLLIHEGKTRIVEAPHLWGKGIKETEEAIRTEIADSTVQIVSIGPAGEKGVLFANLVTDGHRAFGRGGCGAVMGAKNLKAIVIKGTHTIPVANPELMKQRADEARKELFEEEFIREELHPYGTPSFYDAIDTLGLLPTRNWQQMTFPEGKELLGYEEYHKRLEVKPYACYGCPIACGRKTTIREGDGKWAGMSGGGPEYETVAAFGSKCFVTDLTAITAANHIANDLGLDVIATGQVIATAMEWFEKGILTPEDTGGIDLSFGNGDAVVEMVKKIAAREGLGDLLAQGVKRAAEKLGGDAGEAAMHVKGVEMPADGARASHGESITLATSARGADHLRPFGSTIDAFAYRDTELGITGDVDILEDDNKGWVKPLQELSMATNMLGVCLFASITLAVKASTWAKLLSASVGTEITKERLLLAAERVINLERVINAKYGLDRKDDTLPERLRKTPAPDGPGQGSVVNLEEALDSYYSAMGWDLASGLPTRETLGRLGMDSFIEI